VRGPLAPSTQGGGGWGVFIFRIIQWTEGRCSFLAQCRESSRFENVGDVPGPCPTPGGGWGYLFSDSFGGLKANALSWCSARNVPGSKGQVCPRCVPYPKGEGDGGYLFSDSSRGLKATAPSWRFAGDCCGAARASESVFLTLVLLLG
jgi:hypothetical protein